jgi:hypothetical protein
VYGLFLTYFKLNATEVVKYLIIRNKQSFAFDVVAGVAVGLCPLLVGRL